MTSSCSPCWAALTAMALQLQLAGACAPQPRQRLPSPTAAASENPYTVFVTEYAEHIAPIVEAAARRYGCDTPTGVRGRLTYYLYPETDLEGWTLQEGARQDCLDALQHELEDYATARLPARCNPGLVFGSSGLALERSEGAECAAANGDEGANASFLCRSELLCVDRRCVPGDHQEVYDPCENPLGLPIDAP